MKLPIRNAIRPGAARVLLPLLLLSLVWIGSASAANRPRGTLGVALGEITPQVQQAAGLQQVTGAVIQQVLPDSAAARVGLQPGDLIVGVDGAGVSGPAEVVQRVGQHGAGESVALVILRPDGHGHVQQYQVMPVLQAAAGAPTGLPVPQPTPPVPGAPRPQRPPAIPSQLGTGFAGGLVPVQLHVDLYRTCMAVAPANWVIYGSRREGDALDMAAADGSMHAGYGIAGVPGSMIPYYPRSATPESRLHSELSEGGRGQVVYGQPVRDPAFGYTWLPYELPNANYRGGVFYIAWPIPNDPPGYILLQRRAQTVKHLWERQGAQAIAVALSIRCTRQLRPSPDVGGRRPAGDDQVESTYNQQLGMEYAHDAVTGENYWVSPSTDWDDTGPEGPGYYKRSGNERRKLVPGRQ